MIEQLYIRDSRHPVVQAIKERRGAVTETPFAADRKRVLLFAGGGGPAGAYSAGVLAGLETCGLSRAFDAAVGVSVGSINLAFFLAGQAKELPRIYREDFVRLIHPLRFWDIYDMDAVRVIIQQKLHADVVVQHPASFWVGATTLRGRGALLDARAEMLVEAIMASATPPLRHGAAVRIGGEGYLDGEISLPLPIEQMEARFFPTHVLIVLNRPYGMARPSLPLWQEALIGLSLFYHAPFPKEVFLNWRNVYVRGMRQLEELSRRIPVGVLVPSTHMETCRDAATLQKTTDRAFRLTCDVFR